VLSDDKRTA